MKVLAIETSCDETAISLLDCAGGTDAATFTVLQNELYSQAHLHAEYGGVFPTLAKREHEKNLPLLYEKIRASHGEAFDLVAVTQGPGLEPALWQGIEFARALSERLNVPIMGVDHLEGHIVSGLVTAEDTKTYTLTPPAFPLLGLLISGGHTELVLSKRWFEYELIGRTKDDAVGEAFDKVARMIGLEYPGGPKIEALARAAKQRGLKHDVVFPRPMIHEKSCDFSFSGLKTAVLYKLKAYESISETTKLHIADAFQDAAREVLVAKTKRALEETGALTLSVGGGVSASIDIRAGIEAMVDEHFPDVKVAYPVGTLHLDNALMIGMAAYLRHGAGKPGGPLIARGSQSLA